MTDARLVPPVVAAWLGALVGVHADGRASALAAVVLGTAAAGAAAAALTCRRTLPARIAPIWVVVAACVCGSAAVLAGATRAATRDAPALRSMAARGAEVTLDVVVTGDPVVLDGAVIGARRTAGLVRLPARAVLVVVGDVGLRVRHPVTVLAAGPGWHDRLPGERLRLRARLTLPRRAEPVTAVARAHGPPEHLASAGAVQRAAGRLRAGLRDTAARLPGDAAGLLPGLVIGDTSTLPEDLREAFRATGMTHLVAVSGSNAAMFLGLALLLTRRVGGSVPVTAVVGAAALCGFVVLARPSPSVLRAAVMGAIGLLAVVTGRPRAGLPALAGAVLLLLLLDPDLASSPGFALSAAATGGLVLLAPRWRTTFAARLPRRAADAVAVPLAAQVACLPVLAGLFGEVSVLAVPANLLAMPAVGAATAAGVLTALLAPIASPLALAAAYLAAVPTWYLAAVARAFAAVPGGELRWPTGAAGAATMVLALLAVPRLWRWPATRRALLVVVPVALVTTVGVRTFLPGWPPPGWVFVACDVGQGDGLVLRAGSAVLVVDAGPDPALMRECLDRLRVRRVASVVLTHLHADHVEGLPGVLRGRDVAEVVVGPLEEPADEWARVRSWVADAAVPLRRAGPGERWAVGTVSLAVLGPERAFRGTASDPNNSSLVLTVTAEGVRLLLTGDIEQPAQQALLARTPPSELRADVLKVAHHGSDKQLDELTERVGAAIAVTSVGAGNPYGHPARTTMSTLRRVGARSWRTDRDGDVAVGWHDGSRYVVARGGRDEPSRRALDPAAARPRDPAAAQLYCPVRPPSTAAAGEWLAVPPAIRRAPARRSRLSQAAAAVRAPPRAPGQAARG